MMVMLQECSLGLGPEQATGRKACTVRTATDLQYCTAGEGISTGLYGVYRGYIWVPRQFVVGGLILHNRDPGGDQDYPGFGDSP